MRKIFGLLIFALVSCSTGQTQKGDATTEVYKKNKVKKVTTTKIEYADNISVKSTHPDLTSFIDKNGLKTKELRPNYGSFLSEEHGQIRETESNIGDDTITYEYDSRYLLIKRTTKQEGTYNIDEYSYDNLGNEIKNCWIRSNNQNCCFFKTYEYDSNNKILSVKDSAGLCTNGGRVGADNIKKYYKYDDHNNVIDNGLEQIEYKYKGNKIVQKTEGDKTTRSIYVYNDDGQISSDKIIVNNDFVRFENQYMYDDKGLLIERKSLEDGSIKNVYKYKYEYY